MTGDNLLRFKTIYVLAVCIFGLEIFNIYCNYTVFPDAVSRAVLTFFAVLGLAASILIAVAVQKMTEKSAFLAKMLKLAVVGCLVASAIYHAGFARDIALANSSEQENTQKTTEFVGNANSLLDKAIELQKANTEVIKQDNRRIVNAKNYYSTTKTKPKAEIKVTNVENTSIDTSAMLEAVKPKLTVVDKEKIRSEYIPQLWLWQSAAFMLSVFGSALLGSFKWGEDKNQNGIPDDEEDQEED